MKKITICKAVLFATLLFAGSLQVNAQNRPKVFGRPVKDINPENGAIRCVSTEYEEYLQEQNPKRETREQFEGWISQKIQEQKSQRSANSTNIVLTIPVVVHVIHNGDAVGQNENIREGQILSQIQVLNQDYRRMVDTPGYNEFENGADVEIEFCLAQTDPDGNLTNGIDRQNLGVSSWTSMDDINSIVKTSTIWDPERYLNLWTCNYGGDISDVLGYAQFPSSSGLGGLAANGGEDNTDGVVIGYRYFGSADIFPNGNYGGTGNVYRYGRTASHEVGHYLGLRHIWGDNSLCTTNSADSDKDYCPDTPAASRANFDCPFSNTCTSSPGFDMVENYMDYTDDTCMSVFTQDQKERIRTVLQNSPRRASLVTSTACQAPTGGTNDYKLQGLNVYPNPTQGVLTINIANGNLPDSYTIYNSIGQTVGSAKITSASGLTINTSSYSNGVYFIKVDKGNQTKTLKFIKN